KRRIPPNRPGGNDCDFRRHANRQRRHDDRLRALLAAEDVAFVAILNWKVLNQVFGGRMAGKPQRQFHEKRSRPEWKSKRGVSIERVSARFTLPMPIRLADPGARRNPNRHFAEAHHTLGQRRHRNRRRSGSSATATASATTAAASGEG